ncbi:MAG TPA: hypothetical protein VIB07_04870 [Nitrososphaera sp.]|jgi:hypothetical protein
MAVQFRKRKGLGSVITTLIILIASVVLAAGVIFFGGSLFQTNTENEAIQVSNTHIWVSPNGTSSVAGFVIQNTGGKAVAVQKITIRGQSIPSASWYYNNTSTVATAANIQAELKFDDSLGTIDVRASTPGEEQFTQATGPISLLQGQAMFIYLAKPAGINAIDSGLAYTLNVQAGKASAAVASVNVGSS